ncbi:hypothetical protein Bca4012_097414 [Brassica carinata]
MVGGVTPEILYAETPLTLHYNCFVFIHILPVSKPHSMLLYPAQGGRIFVSTIRWFLLMMKVDFGGVEHAAITHSMNDAGSLMSVQFLRRAKIMGKKVMDGVIFASLLDATLRRRRSDRAPVMGVIVKVHCFSVVFCCLHTLLTSYIIFVSRTMMHVVKILRLLAAVSTFKIALFLAAVTLHAHTWLILRIKFGLGPDGKLRFPLINKTHMFSALRQYVSTGNPLWGLRPPHNAPTYDQQPHSTSFFSYKDPGNLSMAIFFLSWYSSILTSYANQVLSVASSTFSGGVSLFGKLPLLYP